MNQNIQPFLNGSETDRPKAHPLLGVCYYPEHWPEDLWDDDAARMQDIGLTYVRIGEFAWSRMEPKQGTYDWAWLDKSIETLGSQNRRVVLCTPTPTPPKWLTDAYPEVLRHDENGLAIKHGSRRHVSVASATYRKFSQGITKAMVERYANNPHVAGWQTDNEYGCHDSTLSYGPEDRVAFGQWLEHKYKTIDRLNAAWGNAFWSQTYDDFAQVDLPNLLQAEANPAHWMDFRRFFSDMTVEFNREQVDIIRNGNPNWFVTHNCMCNEGGFDHWDLAADLDFLSWDSYPLGFLDTLVERFGSDVTGDLSAQLSKNLRIGHPDVVAYHHDLYRSASRGRFWVMEQQPGPVNWATHNPAPVDGGVKFWTLEAIAHGAEVVSYFRWRQAPWSQEQMHTALNTPWNEEDQAAEEAREVAKQIPNLSLNPETVDANKTVALYFDFQADWFFEAMRQGDTANIHTWTFAWYSALRMLGFNIEIFGPHTWTVEKLQEIKLFVFPTMPINRKELLEALPAKALKVFGPRSGSRTEDTSFEASDPLSDNSIKPTPPPYLQAGNRRLFGDMVVWRVESLRPSMKHQVNLNGSEETVSAEGWVEHLRLGKDQEVLASFEADPKVKGLQAAWVRQDQSHYLAFVSDVEGTLKVAQKLAVEAGLETEVLPENTRVRWINGQRISIDYNAAEVSF